MDLKHCLLFLKVVDIKDGVNNIDAYTKLRDLSIGSCIAHNNKLYIAHNNKLYIVTDSCHIDTSGNLFISCCDINSGRLDDINGDVMVIR